MLVDGGCIGGNGGKAGTIHECLTGSPVTERVDVFGSLNGYQRGTALEHTSTDLAGDVSTEVNAYELGTVHEYAFGSEGGDRLGNYYVNDTGTCIHVRSECGKSGEVNEGGKRGTTLEEVASYCDIGLSGCQSDGLERSASVEGVVAERLNRSGNVKADKAFASVECIVANGGYGSGNVDGLEVSAVSECVCGDLLGTFGKNEVLNLSIGECSAHDLNHVGNLVGLILVEGSVEEDHGDVSVEEYTVFSIVVEVGRQYFDGLECRTSKEGVSGNTGNGIGNYNGGKAGAVCKCEVADVLKSGSKSEGLKRGTSVECISADVLNAAGDTNGGDAGTSVECLVTDLGYVCAESDGGESTVLKYSCSELGNGIGKLDVGKHYGVFKCTVADGLDSATVLEADVGKSGTALECVSADGGNGSCDIDGLDTGTTVECVLADLLESGRHYNGLDGGVTVDEVALCRVITGEEELGKNLEACGKNYFLESGTAPEDGTVTVYAGVVGDLLDHRTENDSLQRGTLLKESLSDGSNLTVLSEGYAYKILVLAEYHLSHGGNGVGEGDLGESTAGEAVVSDVNETFLQSDVGELGAVVEGVVTELSNSCGKNYLGKAATAVECVSADQSNSIGNIDRSDSGRTECIGTDKLQVGVLSISEGNALNRAAVECISLNGLYGSGDDYGGQLRAGERVVLDVEQSVGKGKAGSLISGQRATFDVNDGAGKLVSCSLCYGIDVKGGLILVVENSVLGHKVRMILCNVDSGDSVASADERGAGGNYVLKS